MSEEIQAVLIEDVVGYQASGDGKHGLLKVKLVGAESVLAFPTEILPKLMEAASNTAGQAKRITDADPKAKALTAVEWWEIGPHNESVVLSFRIPGGGEMSFAIHRDRIPHMIEVLQTVIGNPPAGLQAGDRAQ